MHLLNGIDFLEAHQDIIFYETTSEIILDASVEYVEYEGICASRIPLSKHLYRTHLIS